MKHLSVFAVIAVFLTISAFCNYDCDGCTDDLPEHCDICCNCHNYIFKASIIEKPCFTEIKTVFNHTPSYSELFVLDIERPPTPEAQL